MSPEFHRALCNRADMLRTARSFFFDRNVMEVDCPAITRHASVDAHIDLISVNTSESERRYLISSPEYGMKRLIAEGIGDIYQISHVYRLGEIGAKHNPEFMMAEWYRLGFSFQEMIDETMDFIHLFLEELPIEQITYREAFQTYAGIDYLTTTEEELIFFLKTNEIPYYQGIEEEGKDALLNLILGYLIEPKLGDQKLTALTHYPATQCALAKTVRIDNEPVAERFEIYHKGLELANGYHELTNSEEQRKRFIEANEHRSRLNKELLPIDEAFLAALKKGLPECCGVAVGFDRLMMLRLRTAHIKEVIPFFWED